MPDKPKEISDDLNNLDDDIEKYILDIDSSFSAVQAEIVAAYMNAINALKTDNGRLIRNQPTARIMGNLQKNIEDIIKKSAKPAIREVLNMYKTIEDRNIAMQQTHNDLIVPPGSLTPARQIVMDRADYYLRGAGLADRFIKPATFLLRQQVAGGANISGLRDLIQSWDSKSIPPDVSMAGQIDNLQTYATQLARDSAYQYNGVINDTIKDKFDLTEFIYAGGLKKSSRPFCRHLVGLDRPIKYDEVEPLLKKYPEGIIPGTNAENFTVYRGGYNCEHLVMPIN